MHIGNGVLALDGVLGRGLYISYPMDVSMT
jgi:hypothetical protein